MGNECTTQSCIQPQTSVPPSSRLNNTNIVRNYSRHNQEHFDLIKNAAKICTDFNLAFDHDSVDPLDKNPLVMMKNNPQPPGKFSEQKLKNQNFQQHLSDKKKR